MGKAVVTMTNWELYVYEGRYNLSGNADNHPRLGKGTYVAHTSYLVDYEMKEDVLKYETRNTVYMCPLKYMRTTPYFNVIDKYKEELIHLADNSFSILDKIISATAKISLEKGNEDEFAKHILKLQAEGQKEIAEMEEKENMRLQELAKQYEDCVYIEVSNIGSGDKLAYHIGDCLGTINPSLHVGMFQDSVLYMKYDSGEEGDCALDFRYFPRGFFDGEMETYSWSDNIKTAVIKNLKEGTIIFNHEEIAPGEIKVFTPDSHRQGLISPDCYNGKSAFNMHGLDGLTQEDINSLLGGATEKPNENINLKKVKDTDEK